MIAILLADGFEEIEALLPLDMLRRAGIEVKTASISDSTTVTGAHRIPVIADMTADALFPVELSGLIFPGGMPGAKNIDEWGGTDALIKKTLSAGGRLAAICAAPMILGKRGYLVGRRAVCYPGFEDTLIGAQVLKLPVVTDGYITTARGMGAALDFASELVTLFVSEEKALELSSSIMESKKRRPSSALTAKVGLPDAKARADELISALDTDMELISEIRDNASVILNFLAEKGYLSELIGVEYATAVIGYVLKPSREIKPVTASRMITELLIALGSESASVSTRDDKIVISVSKRAPRRLFPSDIKSEQLEIPLGRRGGGEDISVPVAKLPHILIGGEKEASRGFLYSALTALIKNSSPDELNVMIIDPTGKDFSLFSCFPHVIDPIITDASSAECALKYAYDEMERRYGVLLENEVRTLDAYNEKMRESGRDTLPRLAIVISNYDKIDNDKNQLYVMVLAQKARAAGIHLIVTSHSEKRYLPGTVKANIPTRLSFRTDDKAGSKRILDEAGAEHLADAGDALYLSVSERIPVRIQAPVITAEELIEELRGLPTGKCALKLDLSIRKEEEMCAENEEDSSDILNDPKFKEAVDITFSLGKISTSLLQRKLGIGYGLAAMLIDYMESFGLISEPDGQKPRELLASREDWEDFIKDKVK